MKNIQIIDGAENCTYSIYAVSEDDFKLIFPVCGQDIEFAEDLDTRLKSEGQLALYERLWKNPIDKKLVCGIHGSIFYELSWKRKYYPTKIENEMANAL